MRANHACPPGGTHLTDKSPEAFRTISEVSDELDLPQHVWESKFNIIKPLKRGGGRRYYRPGDIDLLRGIRHLLYSEGFTIKGVQKILREQGVRFVSGCWENGDGAAASLAIAARGDEDGPSPAHSAAPSAAPSPVLSRAGGDPLPAGGPGGISPAQTKQLRTVLAELQGALALLEKARKTS